MARAAVNTITPNRYHFAEFDNLRIGRGTAAPSAFPSALFDKYLLWPPTPPPGGPVRPAAPRNDFSGLAGVAITVGAAPLKVAGLGRFAAGLNAQRVHNLTIFDASSVNGGEPIAVASGSIDLAAARGGDVNGFAWTDAIRSNADSDGGGGGGVVLMPGKRYYIVSSEEDGGDTFYDVNVQVQPRVGLTVGLAAPVYRDHTGWHVWDEPRPWGQSYGPINVLLRP